MKKRHAVILCLAAVLAVTASYAEDAENAVTVQITGANVNLLKTLCGETPPEADAALGAMNALKVKEAVDAEGKAIEGLAGKVLVYLPTASASELIAGEANVGKMVTVKGVLYKNAQVLSVKEFEVKAAEEGAAGGEFDEWDELGVTTMSQQQVI